MLEKIKEKMQAYGHGELNTEKFTDLNYIKEVVVNSTNMETLKFLKFMVERI